jgi:hypothetical protein
MTPWVPFRINVWRKQPRTGERDETAPHLHTECVDNADSAYQCV